MEYARESDSLNDSSWRRWRANNASLLPRSVVALSSLLHRGHMAITCSECGKNDFTAKRRMRQHMRQKHPLEAEPAATEEPNRSVLSSPVLGPHLALAIPPTSVLASASSSKSVTVVQATKVRPPHRSAHLSSYPFFLTFLACQASSDGTQV